MPFRIDCCAMTSPAPETQINRTVIFVSLGLAIALVLGAIFGARAMFHRAALTPVAMPELPSPMAGSPECTSLIDGLPARLANLKRAELAEPAPEGAAAWQGASAASGETERITVRCGTDTPLQYTEFASTISVGGATWMRVDDVTPGSTMSTWFTTDRSPVLAVTANAQRYDADDILPHLGAERLPQAVQPTHPAPLSGLAQGDTSRCDALMGALPDSIAEGYERAESDVPASAVWVAEGRDPIVVRCGVQEPGSYAAGAQLIQVNDIPWFEDTNAGTVTAATLYALGRDTTVAASIPQGQGNAAITALSDAVAQHTAPVR